MTAISANDTGLPAWPVTSWENEGVKGAALCGDGVHADNMKRVDELRAQQARYRASLPVEPKESIKAALKELCPKGESYPNAFEEALHLSHALRPMVQLLKTEHPGPERDALLWIADRICFGLGDVAMKLDYVTDILGNPAKIERQRTP